MKYIDAHVHSGTIEGDFDLNIDKLMRVLDKLPIEFAIVSNIHGSEFGHNGEEIESKSEYDLNMETAEWLKKDKRLRAAAWCKPHKQGNVKVIEQFLKDYGFVALKFHPYMSRLRANDAKYIPYIELAQKYKVPVVFHTAVDEFSKAEYVCELAKKFPDVQFVLYHMDLGSDNKECISMVKKILGERTANLFVDTCWVSPDSAIKAIDEIGADRVLFGTDAPIDGEEHYQKYTEQIKKMQEYLSEEDFQKVMYYNAKNLFKIN